MINLLEKYNKVSWMFVVIIAVIIFYLSSLTIKSGSGGGFGWQTTVYHFFAFFFLAFFLLPALVKGKNKKLIFLAAVIAILYSISDEFHQLFVPGRYCTLSDVMINSFGILFASLIYSVSLKRRFKVKS